MTEETKIEYEITNIEYHPASFAVYVKYTVAGKNYHETFGFNKATLEDDKWKDVIEQHFQNMLANAEKQLDEAKFVGKKFTVQKK